jgi:predicted alpha/beta-fold hydrolase
MVRSQLTFRPYPGLSSSHLQTIIGAFRPPGTPPPSERILVPLEDGDLLSCEVSIPVSWSEEQKTVVLVHGLGGSHTSPHMVRISRKFYRQGYRVVRVNLRGCGSGKGLANKTYYGGASHDIRCVLEFFKQRAPKSPHYTVGFSLGGNIILKLAGELGKQARDLVFGFIAICPPLDLAKSVRLIERYPFYHVYYLNKLRKQARFWLEKKVRSLYEFDDTFTAPMWGYSGADEYYRYCSSIQFLPRIAHRCHLLFAEDDPFVDIGDLPSLPDQVHAFSTKFGGHMGFIGKTEKAHRSFWLDQVLIDWV